MADILSQEEVDMLLSAVSTAEVSPEAARDRGPAAGQYSIYDFRRSERISAEQLKGLQSLFDAFAREVSIQLPPFLRTVVRVDLTSIDQLTYDEFILSVARPTSLTIVNMAPLEGNAVIELNPAMIFPIVDRVLGGRGEPLSEPRELTEIEERIVHRVVLMILGCLRRSWDQLIDFELSIVNQESDPLIVQIVAGSEMVVLVGYEIHIGDNVGAMNVCIPLNVLSPVLEQISQQTHFRRKLAPDVALMTRNQIERTLRKARVAVAPILGRARLCLSDVLNLRVGDIVQLDAAVKAPIPVEIENVARFFARPGRVGEGSAVQIIQLLRES